MEQRFGIRGLGAKLIGLTLLTLLTLLGITVLIGIRSWIYEQRASRENLEQRGRMLTEAAAIFCLEPMLSRDYPVLETYAHSLVATGNDIRFVQIQRRDERVVVTASAKIDERSPPNDSLQIFRTAIRFEQAAADSFGQVSLGISVAAEKRHSYAHIMGLIKDLLIQALAAALALFLLLRIMFLNPIRRLGSAAEKLGEGDLETPLPPGKRDEVGMLRDALEIMRRRVNRMVNQAREHNAVLNSAKENLEQALTQAESASRAKSEFLAMMSHEIRTPMNGVLGVATLLQGSPLDKHQSKLVELLQSSGHNLLNVINEILDFSKIEAGKLEITNDQYQPGELTREIVDLLTIQAKAKDIQLTFEPAVELPEYVMGDSARVRQILLNLLGNAIKFTSTGSVTLRMMCTFPKDDVAQIRWEIQDTGIGIPQEDQKRLFEPFIQADSGTNRRYGGTGLGLTISQRLVDLMGGQIGLESQPEVGSTFWFTLLQPLISDGEMKRRDMPVNLNCSGDLLLVEDNQINQHVAKHLLEQFGFRVTLAEDGHEAIAALEEQAFDVVLMDCQMPGMDGYQATREIRRRKLGGEELPIIAMTAHAMQGDREQCLACGMNDYISKPVDRTLLIQTLSHWLPETATS